MSRLTHVRLLAMVLAGAWGIAVCATRAAACPFCGQVQQTFGQEIAGADAAVIARLVEAPPRSTGSGLGDSLPKSKFEIISALKGEKLLAGRKRVEVICLGDYPLGATFLITAIEPPDLNWAGPIQMDARACKYLEALLKLPEEGPERLLFFQDYLEDKNDTLARDAFDEFAKAPYAEVRQLKEHMRREKLREWIASPDVTPTRRRLYLMMLGVCGQSEDVAMLEGLINSPQPQKRMGLDAIIWAYLSLKGPDGMTLVEDKFLKNKEAEYTETHAAIMALRTMGQEGGIVPRERLLAALRTILDRPQLADLVIPDLARWEDWSVVDRLYELFVAADAESSWIRVPVITYLRVCPLPAAKARLEECAKLDPQAMRQSRSFMMMPGAGGPSTKVPAGDKSPRKTNEKGTKTPAAGAPPEGDKSAPKTGAAPASKPSLGPPGSVHAEAVADEPGGGDSAVASGLLDGARSTSSGAETAAIGVTPLAAAAIADPGIQPIAAGRVVGALAVAGASLLGAMWWLLAGG